MLVFPSCLRLFDRNLPIVNQDTFVEGAMVDGSSITAIVIRWSKQIKRGIIKKNRSYLEREIQMNLADLRAKVWEEIEHVPDDKLVELYHLVQTFRQLIEPTISDTMSFAGCWSDLPEDIYSDFLNDLSDRRQQAFSERRTREARPD